MVDITIRAVEVSDWEDIAALRQCPKVYSATLGMPYKSAAKTRQQLEKLSTTRHHLVAIKADTGQLVGEITLDQESRSRRQHVGYIGMDVHDHFHGQGIGSQLVQAAIDIADNWLNLKRLELAVYVDNDPAVHLYQKFDFVIEGTLKKFAFRAGNYIDAYTMARIV